MATVMIFAKKKNRLGTMNELPGSKLTGHQKMATRIPKGVTPECFNRGSTVLLTTTLSHVKWVGVQLRSPLDSRRFESLTVPRAIEGWRDAFGNKVYKVQRTVY